MRRESSREGSLRKASLTRMLLPEGLIWPNVNVSLKLSVLFNKFSTFKIIK